MIYFFIFFLINFFCSNKEEKNKDRSRSPLKNNFIISKNSLFKKFERYIKINDKEREIIVSLFLKLKFLNISILNNLNLIDLINKESIQNNSYIENIKNNKKEWNESICKLRNFFTLNKKINLNLKNENIKNIKNIILNLNSICSYNMNILEEFLIKNDKIEKYYLIDLLEKNSNYEFLFNNLYSLLNKKEIIVVK